MPYGNVLVDGLRAQRDNRPEHTAVTDFRTSTQRSFSNLWLAAESAAMHLYRSGARPGQHVVMTLPLGSELIAYCYGAAILGAVPAFVDPNQPLESLAPCLADLDAAVWVSSIPDPARGLYRGSIWPPDHTIFDAGDSDSTSKKQPWEQRAWSVNDTVLMLYTSGTTGIPKGVPWTSRELSSQMRYYGDNDIRSEFCLFPHLALVSLAIGRRVVLPDLSTAQPAHLDIDAFYRQLAGSGSDYLFASPLVWHRLVTHIQRHSLPAPKLRRAATAGSAIGVRLIERMRAALDPTDVVVPYASTEALMPITVVGADEHIYLSQLKTWNGKGTPLGRPTEEMQVRIISPSSKGANFDVTTASLDTGVAGEIIVAGPRVVRTYHRRDDAVAASKLRDSPTGEIWHRTGDHGYIDDSGLVWYLCRNRDVVDSPHGPIYPDALEQMWNMVTGFALSAVVYDADADRLFYVFPHDEDPSAVDIGTMSILAQRLHFPGPTPLQLPGALPTDPRHNSKIDRDAVTRLVRQITASGCS
ncbi:AMP-binding protein [Rhodococcus sp. F64268]|uniref:AMP-binding protein n=1 Tax=Rhodococcus sp. F64268 TaxID=2926402 RepID=UPI001FF5DE09|nr:AMP-binding protein [Rhodococcus sp. F64268]MCK0091740.1 AMP-binding protein [Rhodococcus sp. F64268]